MNTTSLDNAIDNPQMDAETGEIPRPTDANGNPIYRVPEGNLEALRARVGKLNKRALKLKMDALVLTEIGEGFEEHTKSVRDDYDPDMDNGFVDYTRKPIKYTIRIVLVTLTGTCPRVNGWTMAATIQHEEGGNILRTVPGFETSLPLQYRTNGTICEHCETNRVRKDTYVLQSETNGWKQVGRNCLADFLRSSDASGLAEWAEILACIDEEMHGFEDEGWGGGSGRSGRYFTALSLLTQVACCIRADGWCSRTEAKNSYDNKCATVDSALFCMDSKSFSKQSAKFQEAHTPTEADGERAKAAIEWAQALPADTTSDYMWNIRVISHKEHIGHREAGLGGSIIAAYNRHMEQELARKYERDNPSEFFGTVGKREIFTLTVTGFRDIASDFGSTTLVSFRDASGNIGKWFASNCIGFELAKTYQVKASVKNHEVYKESKQTLLTRCSIYDAALEAQQKANSKIIKATLKKRYSCPNTHQPKYNYIDVPELDQYAQNGSWSEICCKECFDAWTARAENESLDKEVSAIAVGQVAYA